MTNILIPNPEHLQKTIDQITLAGKEHFHVIADFDRTLTRAVINGKMRSGIEAVLEETGYLGKEYVLKSKVNFDKYYPIEIDPTIPLAQKRIAMVEWRTDQFKNMFEAGLTKAIIKKTIGMIPNNFRIGHEYFFDTLNANNIPLLVFSATGLGYEAIYYGLEKEHRVSVNVEIIANTFIRNEEGKAIGVKEPIIHTFNKGEVVVRDLPVYEKIKSRKNIILLGDSLGDTHMADGFDYENIIKIGFLNHDTPENREKYQQKFDLIILDDGPMDEVNKLLEKILK